MYIRIKKCEPDVWPCRFVRSNLNVASVVDVTAWELVDLIYADDETVLDDDVDLPATPHHAVS